MKIAVFCSSTFGNNSIYKDSITNLADALSKNSHDLVYGGSKSGLMGVIADSMIEKKSNIIGVITNDLDKKELAHNGLSTLHRVETMQERKTLMYELSDAFIIAPGGCGTMEEFFEIYSWGQLGYHNKPIAIYNIDGYYDQLIKFIKEMSTKNFLQDRFIDMLIIDDNPQTILDKFKSYTPPLAKWS